MKRGEVWIVDLGLAAKVRPCLLLTDYPRENERMLVTVVPHTTSVRGTPSEVIINKGFLKRGAFGIQQNGPQCHQNRKGAEVGFASETRGSNLRRKEEDVAKLCCLFLFNGNRITGRFRNTLKQLFWRLEPLLRLTVGVCARQ